MKKLLSNRLYLTTFLADTLSDFGDVLYYLALMTYVTTLPDAKFAISLITFSESLPFIFQFLLGMMADKVRDKLKVINISLFLRVLIYSLVGLLMGFSPGLWIVLVVVILNFISDMAGRFESSLFLPVSLYIIPQEDREVAMGFRQTFSQIFHLIFQASGAVLVTLMSMQVLAFFNAGTFLVSLLTMLAIRPSLAKLLPKREPVPESQAGAGEAPNKPDQTNFFQEIIPTIKMVFREVRAVPELRMSAIIIPVLNGLCSVATSILVLYISQFKGMAIVNPATSLVLFTTAVLVMSIVGSSLVMTGKVNLDLMTVLRWSSTLPVILFVAFLFHNSYGVLLFAILGGLVSGLVGPKFSALMMNALPEDRLATIGAGISTYFTVTITFCQVLLSLLVLVLTADQISWIFLLASLGLVVYALMMGKKKD